MSNCYIVAGPGRTGSSLIAALLGNDFKLPVLIDCNADQVTDRGWVLHTHNPRLQLNPDAYVIISKRNDLFATVISSCIASNYNEWHTYTDNSTPFEVDPEEFEQRYIWSKRWYEAFDTYTTYYNKVAVEFSTLISRYNSLFGTAHTAAQLPTNRSKRDSKAVITNYAELFNLFQDLERDDFINTAPIDTFRWHYDE